MRGNKKKTLGAKSGLYGGWSINSTFRPSKKVLVYADVKELGLSWCTMIRLLLFVFKFIRRLQAIKLCSTTQSWSSYVAWPEQSIYYQFYRRNRRPFASKCFVREQIW